MLKLMDLSLNGHILTMTVLIEGDANRAYQLSVDIGTERYSVVNSKFHQNTRYMSDRRRQPYADIKVRLYLR